jgi:hypothetical protein
MPDMNQIIFDHIALVAANSDLVFRRLLDALGVIGILLIVLLYVMRARERAKMTPEERAERPPDECWWWEGNPRDW